mgnify:FL=1
MTDFNYREYKSPTPELFKELDEAVRTMWYAPNPELGKMFANDLINRVLQLEREKFVIPLKYKSLAYFYGDWLKSYHTH